ncbi:hypothetical protein PENTCL1PPCAC_6740, partial [Pristionchus entomophagus]
RMSRLAVGEIREMSGNDTVEGEMWNKACFLSRLVASSVRVSQSAGDLIKGILARGELGVIDKGSESVYDPQTEADRAAQYLIVQSLHKKFKDICIIGEEEKVSAVEVLEDGASQDVLSLSFPSDLSSIEESNDVVVWVDPLDGTTELARAKDKTSVETLQQVTVLIGIAYKGSIVGGVIHQPWSFPEGKSRTVWAVKGLGVHGIDVASQKKEKVIVTTRSHGTATVEEALQELKRRGLSTSVERVGGAGFKVLKVLEGSAAYVFASPGCKKWDTAAPQAVLEAAGGTLTDISGRPLVYSSDIQKNNSGGVLATSPWVNHSEYLSALPDALKQSLPEFLPRK